MSDFRVHVQRNPDNQAITSVEVRDGWQLVGCWKDGHDDVWAASLSDKDEVRRLVQAAVGRQAR
jgi:hypothetical protein